MNNPAAILYRHCAAAFMGEPAVCGKPTRFVVLSKYQGFWLGVGSVCIDCSVDYLARRHRLQLVGEVKSFEVFDLSAPKQERRLMRILAKHGQVAWEEWPKGDAAAVMASDHFLRSGLN